MVKVNVANWERALRVIVGIALIAYGTATPLTADSTWAAVLIIIAGIMLTVVGTLGWCPVYEALGFSADRRAAELKRISGQHS